MSDHVEQLLESMPLKGPSEDLDRRVMVTLRPPRRRGLLWVLPAAAVAAAAAVVLAVIVQAPTTRPQPQSLAAGDDARRLPAPVAFDPVRLENTISRVDYDDTLELDLPVPIRTFRRTTLHRVFWIDPRRDIRMEMTVPTQELFLVAAEAY